MMIELLDTVSAKEQTLGAVALRATTACTCR